MQYSSTNFANIGNVTKKTLRHYDKINLLKPSFIDSNGYWYYDDSDLNKLQLIRNLQVLGFNLNEIKLNIDNDFELLKTLINEKKLFVDEQIIQLELAKRLLAKIEYKSELPVLEALKQSFEEEHIEWFKRNLSFDQFNQIIKMFQSESSIAEHESMISILRNFKAAYKKKSNQDMLFCIKVIKDLLCKHNLDNNTIIIFIDFFIKSNLDGPLSTRILTIKESVKFLELVNSSTLD